MQLPYLLAEQIPVRVPVGLQERLVHKKDAMAHVGDDHAIFRAGDRLPEQPQLPLGLKGLGHVAPAAPDAHERTVLNRAEKGVDEVARPAARGGRPPLRIVQPIAGANKERHDLPGRWVVVLEERGKGKPLPGRAGIQPLGPRHRSVVFDAGRMLENQPDLLLRRQRRRDRRRELGQPDAVKVFLDERPVPLLLLRKQGTENPIDAQDRRPPSVFDDRRIHGEPDL